jgi:hypothetical protein
VTALIYTAQWDHGGGQSHHRQRHRHAAVLDNRSAATICQPSRLSVARSTSKNRSATMMDMVRTALRKIAAARAKRQRDKIEDKMVADLEALAASMKRVREHAERDRNEIRRTA